MANEDRDQRFEAEVEPLLQAARAGSADALGQLLHQCRKYLLAVANSEFSGALQAKAGPSDIVQDALLDGVRLFDRFTGQTAGELRHWLVAILRNHLLNFARRYRGVEKRQIGREQALDDQQKMLVDSEPSPSSAAAAQEQEAALMLAMQRLPELQRQIIRWRNWDNLPFAEIGRRLNRSEDAARMQWVRALEDLKKQMGTQDSENA